MEQAAETKSSLELKTIQVAAAQPEETLHAEREETEPPRAETDTLRPPQRCARSKGSCIIKWTVCSLLWLPPLVFVCWWLVWLTVLDPVDVHAHCFRGSSDVAGILRARGQDLNDNPFEQHRHKNRSSAWLYLLHRYRPVVRLDSRERFFPVTVEFFVNSSALCNGQGEEEAPYQPCNNVIVQPGKLTVYDLVDEQTRRKTGVGGLLLKPTPSSYAGQMNDRTPMYGDVRLVNTSHLRFSAKQYTQDPEPDYSELEQFALGQPAVYWELRYLFYYTFNGPVRPLGLQSLASFAHVGDIEHITVRVDYASGSVIDVFFAAHAYREAEWKKPGEFDLLNDTHPVVYSALFSHASYPNCGTIARRGWHWILPRDRADGAGLVWFSDEVVPLMPDSDFFPANYNGSLSSFQGFWGSSSVTCLGDQRWFISEYPGDAAFRDWQLRHQRSLTMINMMNL